MNYKKLLRVFFIALFVPIAFLFSGCEDLTKDIQIELHTPSVALIGVPVEITYEITNSGTTDTSLYSFYIEEEFIRSNFIKSSIPLFQESIYIPVISFRSYEMKTPFAAGETISGSITFLPTKSGNFQSDLDICFDEFGSNCLYNFISILVLETEEEMNKFKEKK